MATGSSIVAINRSRPPQRGHASGRKHPRAGLSSNTGSAWSPVQLIHLRGLRAAATKSGSAKSRRLAEGLKQSILLKNRRTDAAAWGGWVGLLWMTGYWATLIPAWVYSNVVVFSTR